jgi:hypothetical protein
MGNGGKGAAAVGCSFPGNKVGRRLLKHLKGIRNRLVPAFVVAGPPKEDPNNVPLLVDEKVGFATPMGRQLFKPSQPGLRTVRPKENGLGRPH